MPDLAGLLMLAVLAVLAAAFVLRPILRRGAIPEAAYPSEDLAPLATRHRIAVESLRDVEADHRAGTLDDQAYQALREEAETRAAQTLAELEAASGEASVSVVEDQVEPAVGRGTPRLALGFAAALGVLLVVGALLPPPVSLGNATVVDQQLAAAQDQERDRQHQIQQLLGQLQSNPNDPPALVRLANLYLAGGAPQDTATAANLLLAAIKLEPKNADAYRLLISAYISTGDYRDARSATDSFATLGDGMATDVAFFRGLIAYRGSGDRAEAIRWFDAFLRAAPNDPRATMIRSLRAEAKGELPGSSASPAP